MPPSSNGPLDPDTDLGEPNPSEDVPRNRLRLLLKEFAALDDAREPWRVLYPLHEVLLLVTCATIASCDDFDDIVAWGTPGARTTSPFCAASPPSTTASPARAGCAPSSTASTRSCSDAASRAGSPRCGQTATISLPSTARPPGAPTTAGAGSRPYTP